MRVDRAGFLGEWNSCGDIWGCSREIFGRCSGGCSGSYKGGEI